MISHVEVVAADIVLVEAADPVQAACLLIRLAVWGGPTVVAESNPEPTWRTIDRRLLADRSPYAMVYDEDIELPDGGVVKNFMRVELPPFVITLAITADQHVAMVRQYRQAIGGYTMELPAGHIDGDEDALVAAKRELLEETGLEGTDWRFLGKFVMDANRECGWAFVYLTQGAYTVTAPDPGDLGEMSLHFLSLDEVRRRWMEGEFVSAPTSLCLGLALSVLDRA